jgi:sugar fermentation stimulation protein A
MYEFKCPQRGKILKRYKRFLADIELDSGEVITAHTPNTGSMTGQWEPGWPALVSYHNNPKRKLKYTLEMTHCGSSWIGVNTMVANNLVFKAIVEKKIPEFVHYNVIKKEPKVDSGRLDLLLALELQDQDSPENLCYVEIKSVTLKQEPNVALFPDAVTQRGQKHLLELMKLKKQGFKTVLFFLLLREDVTSFSPAFTVDPDYAKLLQQANQQGVEILAYQCQLNEKKIVLKQKIPVELTLKAENFNEQ